MKFSYKNLERLVPNLPTIEILAEKITAHLFEIESYENGVLDVKILPNRYSDAACYRGLAREIAAICKLSYKEPKLVIPKAAHKNKIQPAIEVPNLCRRLIACRVEGISLGSTPAWMKEALETYGIRSINGLVDITNYVTIETGQPLHAFDADKMEGNELVARQAHEGEVVTTLDGKEIKLNPSALVLSDARNALDIAGIKGGTRAEISSKTKNIVLTAGNFDGTLIYKTSKRVGISTDASIRFSHNISPALAERGILRALELIAEVCGGKAGAVCDTHPKPVKPVAVAFDIKRFNALTGLAFTEADCLTSLKRLGFTIVGKKVTPPIERTDITRFEDVVEEITRLVGYADLPATPPRITVTPATPQPMRRLKDSLQDMLVPLGFTEILTRSFSAEGEVALENPLTSEQAFLRPSLMEGARNAVILNLKSFEAAALFEIGSAFHKKTNHEPAEEVLCGIALASKGMKDEEAFRAVRGIVETILTRLGVGDALSTEENKALAITIKGDLVGKIIRLEAGHVSAYAELSLTKLLPHVSPLPHYTPIPKYPSIVRDVSFMVAKNVKIGTLMDAAWHDTPKDLTDIRFISLYEGKGMPEGKKSATLRFVFQSNDRTLTDPEADSFLSYIVDAMKEKLAFEIR
ncbi:MAG: phenylalanine--tRNA ligase subunit beta [bacterium]|nr:phenylalanine--tRNA ligase subunit beta [bacterium]